MNNKINKNIIFLVVIALISLVATFFTTLQNSVTILLILLLIYFIVTKRYIFDVFKASKAYKEEDFKKALEHYRDAAMSPWCNSPTITNYLICELKYGKTSLAKEYIEENLPSKNIIPNQMTGINITKAIVLWKTGQVDAGINLLKDMITTCNTTYLYETLTTILLSSRRFSEVSNYIEDAMNYDEESNVIKSNYAEYKYHTNNFEESKKIFNSLIEENVKFIEPYYYVALMESNNNNHNYALELLQTAEGFNDSMISLLTKNDVKQAQNTILVKSLNN